MRFRPARIGVLALLIAISASAADAQDASPQPSPPASASGQKAGPSSPRGNTAAPGETRRLPEDSTTRQTITVDGRTMSFSATAGSLRLFNQNGDPQADIAYTAYQLDGTDPRTRPVTFFFNGGPGASSAYLQLGNAGPWRLPIEGEGAISSASPALKPNAETWLDFTDLVFVDPVDTGFSRFIAADGEVRKHFFSV